MAELNAPHGSLSTWLAGPTCLTAASSEDLPPTPTPGAEVGSIGVRVEFLTYFSQLRAP